MNNAGRSETWRGRGTTLWEVVAGVTAVGLIAGAALPPLGQLRRQDKEIRCIANLGRLAGAAATFSALDRDENLIPVHRLIGTISGADGSYEWGGKSGAGEPQSGDDPASSKWGTDLGRGPATRPLNNVLYGKIFPNYQEDPGANEHNWLTDRRLQLDAFRCPADTGYSGHHYTAWRNSKLTSYDHYGNSYAGNAQWVGVPGGNCRLLSNSPFLRPATRVPNPRHTILFQENAGRFAWRSNYGYGTDDCQSISGLLSNDDTDNPVYGWHGTPNIFEAAFVDGHAGTIHMKGHIQPQPDIGHFPPFNGQPTNYQNWRCTIIRGSGWQLDTLPAPPVLTYFNCNGGGVPVLPID